MTVRVNKSAFNIREKLSELAVKFGLKGSELMRAETAQEARDLVSAGRRNIVINGDMAIDQRNNGSAFTLSNGNGRFFCVDRFQLWNYPAGVTGVYTLQRLTSNPAPGFYHYLRWTVSTATTVSSSATSFYAIQQTIEGNNLKTLGIGTSHAKPSVISFWVRSSLAGNRSFSLFVSGGAVSNYTVNYTITQANVWEHKTIKIPPLTSGTGEQSGAAGGLILSWSMGMGTTYGTTDTTDGFYANKYELGNAVIQVETVNSTFDITGVQFEVGKNATDFEYRPYGEELALCQRYYYKYVEGTMKDMGTGTYYNNNLFAFSIHFPVTMRIAPSLDYVSGTGYYGIYSNNSFDTFNNMIVTRGNTNSIAIDTGTGTSGTIGYGGIITTANSNSYVAFNAEL